MNISGHKTRSILDSYNMVNDEDLRMAALKHDQYLNGREETMVTETVTVADFRKKKEVKRSR